MATGTVNRLVVEIGSNTMGLRRGLAEADSVLQIFGRTAQASLNAGADLTRTKESAALAAREMVADLTATFRTIRAAGKETFGKGLIDEPTLNRTVRDAAQAMNAGLLGGLDGLRNKFGSQLTQVVQNEVIEAMSPLGFKAAESFTRGVSMGLGQYGPKTFVQSLTPQSLGLGQFGPQTLGQLQAQQLAMAQRNYQALGYNINSTSRQLGPALPNTSQLRTNMLQEFADTGLQGVGAFSTTTVRDLQNVENQVTNTSRSFRTFQTRGVTAMVGLGFAIEAFANGSEGYMRRALRSIAIFAAAFGPEGMIVSATLIGFQAVYDFFNKSKKEADSFTAHAKEQFKSLESAGDDLSARTAVAMARATLTDATQQRAAIMAQIRQASPIPLPANNDAAVTLAQTAAGGLSNDATRMRIIGLADQYRKLGETVMQSSIQVDIGTQAITNAGKNVQPLSPAKLSADLEQFTAARDRLKLGTGSASDVNEARAVLQKDETELLNTLKNEKEGQRKQTLSFLAQIEGAFKSEIVKGPKIDVEKLDARDMIQGIDQAIQGYGDLGAAIAGAKRELQSLRDVDAKNTRSTPAEQKAHTQNVGEQIDLGNAIKRGENFDPNILKLTTDLSVVREALAAAEQGESDFRGGLALFSPDLSDLSDAMNQMRQDMNGAFDETKPANVRKQVSALNVEMLRAAYQAQKIKDQQSADSFLGNFTSVLTDARAKLLSAQVSGMLSGANKKDVEAQTKTLRTNVEQAAEAALKNSTGFKSLSGNAQQLVLKSLKEGLDDVGANTDLVTDKTDRWTRSLDRASRTLSAMGQMSRTNADTFNALSDVASTASSVSTAVKKQGQDAGADIEAVLSIAKTVSDFMNGPRELQREANRIMNTNNDRLKELNLTMEGFIDSASNNLNIAGALSAFLANPGAVSQLAVNQTHKGGFLGTQTQGDLQSQINALQPFLSAAGVTFDQLKKIATDRGINLFDKDGRIVVGTIQQLIDAIQDNSKIISTYNMKLYSDVTSSQSLLNAANNVLETPQQQLKDAMAAFTQIDPTLGARFSGLNASSVPDQNSIRQIVESIAAMAANNQLSATDLGGFTNLSEFQTALMAVINPLNTLTDTVNGVNNALTNVPDVFKIALQSFDAALGVNVQDMPQVPSPTPISPVPVQFNFGDIVVPPGTTQDQAAAILSTLEQAAGQQYGNTTQWTRLTSKQISAAV